MKGDSVTEAHAIIRMFALCESMKWSHLPMPGGLYAQHPDLLDGFRIIFSARAEHEAEEEKKRKSESKRLGSRGGRGASRSHR